MRWNSKICKYGDICDIFLRVCVFYFSFCLKLSQRTVIILLVSKFMNLIRFMNIYIYNIPRKFWKDLIVKANLLNINLG